MATKQIVWSMKELADIFKKRQLNNFDVNICITGARGSGKSTFAVKLLRKIGSFKLSKDLAFSRDEVSDQMNKKRFGIILADEMVMAGHNREFFSPQQKELIQMLNTQRDHCNIFIGCIPFFYDLDPQIRKFFVCRIEIIRRGMGIIKFAKTDMLYQNDPWDTEVNKKKELKWSGYRRKNPRYQKLTTFAGYIKFGKMKITDEEMYQKIKDEKRAEFREEEKKDPKKETHYRRLAEEAVKGRLTREALVTYSIAQNVPLNNVRTCIGHYLPLLGTTKKLHELLIMSNNKKNLNSIKPKLI